MFAYEDTRYFYLKLFVSHLFNDNLFVRIKIIVIKLVLFSRKNTQIKIISLTLFK